MANQPTTRHPLEQLDDSDREFVIRFVLLSGSLKDVAQSYGVSYPTIRAKLDRIVARLEEIRRGQPVSPFKELIADLVAKGEMAAGTARRILDEHRKESENSKET